MSTPGREARVSGSRRFEDGTCGTKPPTLPGTSEGSVAFQTEVYLYTGMRRRGDARENQLRVAAVFCDSVH